MKPPSLLAVAGLLPAASSDTLPILNALGEPSYGVDVSFPVHYIDNFRDRDLLGDRRKLYDDFVEGCRGLYSKGCDHMEKGRVAMCVREPPAMENYTDAGYKLVETPPHVARLLRDFWETNYERRREENNIGNLYVNHWAAKTYLVDVEENSLRGGGNDLRKKVWAGVRTVLEEWSGIELAPAMMYGIREYEEGAILSPHVDRKPFIISCILNVAQDVEEDWPLEVYGRDGLAYNVTMKAGEMFMYESHSMIHGRPFPLKGKYFANLLINFTPTGKTLRERDGPVLFPGALAHAAATGNTASMHRYAIKHEQMIHEKDSRGWQPIHEAARGGHVHAVRLLVEHGANINERTSEGSSLLKLVLDNHGADHPLVGYLEGLGAEL